MDGPSPAREEPRAGRPAPAVDTRRSFGLHLPEAPGPSAFLPGQLAVVAGVSEGGRSEEIVELLSEGRWVEGLAGVKDFSGKVKPAGRGRV